MMNYQAIALAWHSSQARVPFMRVTDAKASLVNDAKASLVNDAKASIISRPGATAKGIFS